MRYDSKNDYYQILGVQTGATAEEIQQAYRQLAKKMHPDINPSESATTDFQRLNEAYNILGNPEKRIAYDKVRWGFAPHKPTTKKNADTSSFDWWTQPASATSPQNANFIDNVPIVLHRHQITVPPRRLGNGLSRLA